VKLLAGQEFGVLFFLTHGVVTMRFRVSIAFWISFPFQNCVNLRLVWFGFNNSNWNHSSA